MTNVKPALWDKWDAAFKGVGAYLILSGAEHVAKVGFTYAKSGLTTTCYFHLMGHEPVIGKATGGGYDKDSASVAMAVHKLPVEAKPGELIRALYKDDGQHWDQAARDAGFNVIQVL